MPENQFSFRLIYGGEGVETFAARFPGCRVKTDSCAPAIAVLPQLIRLDRDLESWMTDVRRIKA